MSICRLTVQAERDSDFNTIDIALPARTPVCALLPAIVAMADADLPAVTGADDWRLDRLSGSTLDDSMTLAENGIHDGELLILAFGHAPSPPPLQWDPCRTVASAASSRAVAHGVGPQAVCVWAAVVASITLAWAGSGAHDIGYLIAAAAGSGAMAVAAFAIGGTGLRTGAVCLATATGYLAVPSSPSAANAFLAASVGCSMSVLMLRSAGRPGTPATSATLVATATVSALTAAASAAPVVGTVPTSAIGATLAVASIGLLSMAPRLSILASGLRPDDYPDDCHPRAEFAHTALTGLVVGCSVGATIGTLVVLAGCRSDGARTLASSMFTVVVGVALMLRARTHVDHPRRIAAAAGGLCSLTAALAIVVTAAPPYAEWWSALVIAAGLLAVRHREIAPRAARTVELLEYGILAAVLPLACWVGGVYAFVRESNLL